jgi:cyclopropane-fatty-acyl-phospholipid synthase
MSLSVRVKTDEVPAASGRVLNHAISRRSGQPAFAPRTFISRYVFPDGELQEVGGVVSAMQKLGLEARDVESLREHYTRTLRWWVKIWKPAGRRP